METAQIFRVPQVISGTGKATNFKFGWNVYGVHTNKCPLKFWRKGSKARAYPQTVQIFWIPPIISRTGKATNFKFCTHILSINRKKSPFKISGNQPWARKFLGHSYIGRIARSSLRQLSFLVLMIDLIPLSGSVQCKPGHVSYTILVPNCELMYIVHCSAPNHIKMLRYYKHRLSSIWRRTKIHNQLELKWRPKIRPSCDLPGRFQDFRMVEWGQWDWELGSRP